MDFSADKFKLINEISDILKTYRENVFTYGSLNN